MDKTYFDTFLLHHLLPYNLTPTPVIDVTPFLIVTPLTLESISVTYRLETRSNMYQLIPYPHCTVSSAVQNLSSKQTMNCLKRSRCSLATEWFSLNILSHLASHFLWLSLQHWITLNSLPLETGASVLSWKCLILHLNRHTRFWYISVSFMLQNCIIPSLTLSLSYRIPLIPQHTVSHVYTQYVVTQPTLYSRKNVLPYTNTFTYNI